ncbi:MAG: hypothetical protein AB7G87_09150 [Clostridia bacterium]
MKKDEKVVFKDFGKKLTDTENRDEHLKNYVCSILDVPTIQFDDILKNINNEADKTAFLEIIYNDMEGRIERFFREKG